MKRLTKVLAITSIIILVFAVVLGSTMLTLIYKNAGPLESTAPTVSSDNAFTTETRSPESDTLPNQQETTSVPGTTGVPETQVPEPTGELEFTMSEDKTYYILSSQGTYIGKELIIPETYNGLPVLEIGNSAFQHSFIEKIIIPGCIKSIGVYAFCYAKVSELIFTGPGLERINDCAFKHCQIKEINFPDTLTFIGEYAFIECDNLRSVSIPDSVTTVGKRAFGGCKQLEYIKLSANQGFTGDYINDVSLKTIVIPEGITAIGDFSGCTSLTEIYIPDSVKEVRNHTFNGCKNIRSVRFSNELVSIGACAFLGCESLEKVILPASVISIGDQAFQNSGITTIKAPGVTRIGKNAFNGCNRLTVADFSEKLQLIGEKAFHTCETLTEINIGDGKEYQSIDGVLFTADKKTLLVYPAGKTSGEYKVPSGVEKIEAYAFLNAKIESVSLPDGLKYIGDYAFEYCRNLKIVNFPDSVTEIGNYILYGCRALTTVNYSGTSANWDSVMTPKVGNWNYLIAYITIECSDKTLSISNDFIGFNFKLNEDKTGYILTGIVVSEYAVDIPATYKGLPVVEIGKKAFYNNKIVKELLIPETIKIIRESAFDSSAIKTITFTSDGLKEIEKYAFRSMESLVNIVLPNSLRTIGEAAFNGCSSLKKINVPAGVERLEKNTFNACTSLSEIQLSIGIKYIGEAAFQECAITTIALPYTVEELSSSVFAGCKGLKSITLGSRVKTVHSNAFDGWASCEAINVDSANPYFKSMDGVVYTKDGKTLVRYPQGKEGTEFTVPEGVITISEYAFSECVTLQEAIFPTSLLTIEEKAFNSCTKLKRISIPDNVTSVGVNAFYKCYNIAYVKFSANQGYALGFWDHECLTEVIIPEGITKMGSYKGCRALRQIYIPDSVTEIPRSAFSQCGSLSLVRFPSGLTEIGEFAFANTTFIKTVTLPETTTKIGANAFADSGLTVIKAPGVIEIGDKAFYRCDWLSVVEFSEKLEKIGDNAFSGCVKLTAINVGSGSVYKSIDGVLFTADGKTLLLYPATKSMGEYVVPEGVERIKAGAFYKATLNKVTLPDSLKSIGDSAFCYCERLKSIIIPDSVTEIGPYAFSWCRSAETLVLSNSMTVIPEHAFYALSIKTLVIPEGIAEIQEYAFCHCGDLEEVVIHGRPKLKNHSFGSFCESLSKITFSGTVSEWEALEKEKIWNDLCEKITVICTDGTVEIPKNRGW